MFIHTTEPYRYAHRYFEYQLESHDWRHRHATRITPTDMDTASATVQPALCSRGTMNWKGVTQGERRWPASDKARPGSLQIPSLPAHGLPTSEPAHDHA